MPTPLPWTNTPVEVALDQPARRRQRVRPAVGHLPACASGLSLAVICPNGHALNKAQVEAGGPCPLCKAQGFIR